MTHLHKLPNQHWSMKYWIRIIFIDQHLYIITIRHFFLKKSWPSWPLLGCLTSTIRESNARTTIKRKNIPNRPCFIQKSFLYPKIYWYGQLNQIDTKIWKINFPITGCTFNSLQLCLSQNLFLKIDCTQKLYNVINVL